MPKSKCSIWELKTSSISNSIPQKQLQCFQFHICLAMTQERAEGTPSFYDTLLHAGSPSFPSDGKPELWEGR